MGWGSKASMKMLIRIMSSKKNITQEDLNFIEMISHSYDISDKKYIEPITAELL